MSSLRQRARRVAGHPVDGCPLYRGTTFLHRRWSEPDDDAVLCRVTRIEGGWVYWREASRETSRPTGPEWCFRLEAWRGYVRQIMT